MNKDDEQLVSDYKEGDETALGFLVDRYLKDVYRFSYQLTKNEGMAEDVTQEAFIKAWKHIHTYKQGNSFKNWIFTIARNTAIDLLRKQKEIALSCFENGEGQNVLLEVTADGQFSVEELLLQAENNVYVNTLVEKLDAKYQHVLALRYRSNLTFKAIGQILGKPLFTVKSQHRRAIVLLRRLMEIKPAQ